MGDNKIVELSTSTIGKITKDRAVIYQSSNYVWPYLEVVDWFMEGKEGFKINVTRPIIDEESYIIFSISEYKLEEYIGYFKGITNKSV